MEQLIVGIDIGASKTKAVAVEKSQIIGFTSVQTKNISKSAIRALKMVLLAADRRCEDVRKIAISGGGARLIGNTLLELPVIRVDEILALGLGGLELSGKPQALIVSMGTGTALVIALDKGGRIEHIGGTGVGGGIIEGLSRRMLGIKKFEKIEEMANRGVASNVDLTVAELIGGPIGILPPNATASNFKKLNADTDKNDVAAAIFNMVAEVIGVITVMATKAYHLEKDIVLVGKIIQSIKIAELIRNLMKIFQIDVCIPSNGEYCVAIGAVKSII
ncbi:MAG: pantothenate kinase [Candidatus Bathyarchaeota archaeon]|nr:MAG: pantothenate kinase [Candidatus Bathyarchaeota archaeon]